VQTVIAKVNKKHMKKLTSNPSSIDKCIASLARFGTFSITSRPSCKQLIQQLLIFLNINVHVNNCKFNEITDTSQYYNRHTEHTIHSMIDTQSTQYTVQKIHRAHNTLYDRYRVHNTQHDRYTKYTIHGTIDTHSTQYTV